MGKFDGLLICTDLDGTLLRNDKSISKENVDAIEYFKENGGKFTFITGRMPFYISDMYEKVKPNAPIGCVNGGGVFDYPGKKYVWTQPLDHSALELAKAVDAEFDDIGIHVSAFDKAYFSKENTAMAQFREITKVPNIKCDLNNFLHPIAKILFGNLDGIALGQVYDFLVNHPRSKDFVITRSELTLCEILPKGISKATAMLKIAQHLGIDEDKTVAIGDYNNDIGMIRSAKLGVAVANATEDVKKVADLVTCSNEESAIARIIHGIDMGTIKI